jgi:hypothetical protein
MLLLMADHVEHSTTGDCQQPSAANRKHTHWQKQSTGRQASSSSIGQHEFLFLFIWRCCCCQGPQPHQTRMAQ